MAEILVVADDLTGANAAAAGFARAGFRAVTARAADRPDVVAEMAARFDVVVATVDCRHESPEEARERAASVVRAGWPSRLVCNRIDTTLRGNVGATLDAVLAEVRSLTDVRVVALCAPAHPAAGRHTIGGTQLLGGLRLEETEVARDARAPVRTSEVAALIREQADLHVVAVPMSVVTGPADGLVAAFREAVDAGADVVVADATTEAHLDRLAAAAVTVAEGRGLTWLTCDPGPASVAMARALGLDTKVTAAPLLMVSGSATELTRAQIARLAGRDGTRTHRVVSAADGSIDVDATATLLDQALTDAVAGATVVLASVLDASDLLDLTRDQAEEIPRALARVVRRNLEMHGVAGVLTTGGDVTSAVLSELGSSGLEVSDEVVPLAVAGSVVGGSWDGLPMVTKGGLVGDADTTMACLDHLRRTADLHRRQVATAQSRNPS